MSGALLYVAAGAGLFVMGFWALAVRRHLFWKVLAFNVASSGAFLMLLGVASRTGQGAADPVPQAMVLTGIVVAVSATALALALALRVTAISGTPHLPEDDHG